ncbi:MAG: hypothetical protein QXK37_01795 [Candidatus Woesearchaeota archaeon]
MIENRYGKIYHLVIDGDRVCREKNIMSQSQERRERAKIACKTIELLLEQAKTNAGLSERLIVTNSRDALKAIKQIQPGSKVILYGGYWGYTLSQVERQLVLAGITTQLHPLGYI